MKFQLSAALMGLAFTAVSAQDIQSGPFSLHVKGTNTGSEIDGKVPTRRHQFLTGRALTSGLQDMYTVAIRELASQGPATLKARRQNLQTLSPTTSTTPATIKSATTRSVP